MAPNWGWAWAPLCFDALVTRRPGFPEKAAPRMTALTPHFLMASVSLTTPLAPGAR